MYSYHLLLLFETESSLWLFEKFAHVPNFQFLLIENKCTSNGLLRDLMNIWTFHIFVSNLHIQDLPNNIYIEYVFLFWSQFNLLFYYQSIYFYFKLVQVMSSFENLLKYNFVSDKLYKFVIRIY